MAQSLQVAKVNPWHRRFGDWLISDGMTKGWGGRASKEFGVTATHISIVYNSDAFQDYFQALAKEHSLQLFSTVRDKMVGVVDLAVEQIGLQLDAGNLPTGDLLAIIDTLGKRAGFGEAKATQSSTVVNVGLVTADDLAAARSAMRAPREPQEAKIIELKPFTGEQP